MSQSRQDESLPGESEVSADALRSMFGNCYRGEGTVP